MKTVRKALATFGTGAAAELLALAFPTFADYAARHGYEIIVGDGDSVGRPPSWGKIPLLQRLLDSYDFVLWLDADALILDPTTDVETVVPASAFQAFAVVRLVPGWGITPCCGVWALRASERSQRFLAAVWAQEDLVNHDWWEQTAVMRLTGWTIDFPLGKAQPSEWDDGTFFLHEEWDMVPKFPIGYAPGRIRHYAGWESYRRRAFDMRTDLASPRSIRRLWGLLERKWRPVYWPILGELRHRVTQMRRYRPAQLQASEGAGPPHRPRRSARHESPQLRPRSRPDQPQRHARPRSPSMRFASSRPLLRRLPPTQTLRLEGRRAFRGPFVSINGHAAGHTLLKRGLTPRICVIDIGANRGGFAAGLRGRTHGTYHAVEANPSLVPALRMQLYDSVRHCAVAGGAGTVRLHLADNDEASSILPLDKSSFRTDAVQDVAVNGCSLEDILSAFPGFLDVVKIDIEGAEIVALQSLSAATLSRIGQIAVEFHSADVFGFGLAASTATTISDLERSGFLALGFAPENMDVLFLNRRHFAITFHQARVWRLVAASTRSLVSLRHKIARRLPQRWRGNWGWY